MYDRVIVIENRQKIFLLQLKLFTFENFQLQLQQNRVINYNFVNYNYNFSKPAGIKYRQEMMNDCFIASKKLLSPSLCCTVHTQKVKNTLIHFNSIIKIHLVQYKMTFVAHHCNRKIHLQPPGQDNSANENVTC